MYEHALDWIRRNTEKHGEAAHLMRRARAGKPSWYKLLQGKDVRAASFLFWLENLGFRLVAPGGEELGAADAAGAGDTVGQAGPADAAGLGDLLAEQRKAAELAGKIALLQDLYDKALNEVTDLKAEVRQLREAPEQGARQDDPARYGARGPEA